MAADENQNYKEGGIEVLIIYVVVVLKWLQVTGIVLEVLSNATFKVKLDMSETQIFAVLGGKMRTSRIRVIAGDPVRVELSQYDLTKGRITYRLRKGQS